MDCIEDWIDTSIGDLYRIRLTIVDDLYPILEEDSKQNMLN